MSAFTRKRRLLLNLIGLVILAAGYTAGILVWRAQDRLDDRQIVDSSAPLAPLDSRKDTRQLQVYYGTSGLVMERMTEWFASLVHGRGLAKTLVVLSSAAAIGCFLAANRRFPGS